MSPWPQRWFTPFLLGIVITLGLSGCASLKTASSGDVVFNGPIQEIAPFHDGDYFVWQIEGSNLPSGIYVQKISAGTQSGEYVATMSFSGTAVSRTIFRLDDSSVNKLREDAPTIHGAFVYDTPVPFLWTPLRSSPRRFATGMNVEGMGGPGSVSKGELEEVTWALAVPGSNPEQYEIHRARTIRVGDKQSYSERVTKLQRGIGAIASEETVEGKPSGHTQQICAMVAGKQFGTCPEPLN
ncbi:MAG: hypothetical protein HY270_16895 [Deltaproteobacteria bacterium]|nr:hypothetical protein [Deltaproteobacteria bacterium]